MRYIKLLTTLLFITMIFFAACKDKSKTPPPRAKTPKPIAVEPAQNANGVWHYVCTKRCAGGSATAGNCKTCGTPLIHNGLYHTNTAPTTAPSSGAPFATPPAAAPAKNTAGIFHYTCSKGCVGGSATAGSCVTCGGTLSHNQAYHQ